MTIADSTRIVIARATAQCLLKNAWREYRDAQKEWINLKNIQKDSDNIKIHHGNLNLPPNPMTRLFAKFQVRRLIMILKELK